MPRGHRNQRRKHPAVPTPNSERHYVDDSPTGLWLPTSKQRSAMNLKSEKEKFYYVMWSLIRSSVSRLNECDKNRHCCVENKPHGKMLTGHDKNNVKNQRQTEAESCTCSREQQTERCMFPFILRVKDTFRWGARYRVSWKNIIVYSSQNGCVISGNHPVTLWLNDAAVQGFFFSEYILQDFEVEVMFLICNWSVPLIFLSSEPNEYECKPCLGIFTCLSQIGYQHSWPVKKKEESARHKKGRDPIDWKGAGDHRTQKQTLF